ncbi:MAG: putative bifunctional diguanylate cyclase/phosphodiesterase [Gammaproteobacteria bacterium]
MNKTVIFRTIVLDDTLPELNQKINSRDNNFVYEIDIVAQRQDLLGKIAQGFANKQPYLLAIIDEKNTQDCLLTVQEISRVDKSIPIIIEQNDFDTATKNIFSALPNKILIVKKPFDIISLCELVCVLTKECSSVPVGIDESQQKSMELVKSTLESSNDGILVTNNHGDIVEYNHKLVSMWQIPNSVLKNKKEEPLLRYMQGKLKNAKEFLSKIRAHHAHPDSVSIDVVKFENGNVFECYIQPQKYQKKIIGRIYNFRDITKRIHLEKKVQHQATHDVLTDLPNRIYLYESLQHAVKVTNPTTSGFAVLFMDLDRFKIINTTLGHKIGDEVLQITAKRLSSLVRAEDTLARTGGDEFAILLNSVKDPSSVTARAQEFLNTFQKAFKVTDRLLTVTASIGISLYPQDGEEPEILLRNANTAMYSAKEKGANNFQFYAPEMNARQLEKLDQEMQLREAILKGELELFYQPQFDLADNTLVGAEALIRWRHPDKGLLLPMEFLPIAEETGLIAPIGEWVMQTACTQVKVWQKYLPDFRVAINLSAKQFKQQNMIDLTRIVLKEAQLKPDSLELELPERALINHKHTLKIIKSLKKLGVSIAIDDFGIGYSSLNDLKELNIDRIKINSAFIQQIDNKKEDEIIVRSVIDLAKHLKIHVLAEGVETAEQVEFLKKNQCGEVQGFYFSRPLTAQQFEILIKNHTPQTYIYFLSNCE